MSALDKKKQSVSLLLSRFRGWIQAAATLLTNIHLPNFFKGGIYQGKGKTVCVPGLNCYSCPAASGACPIGAFQAVVGSSKFRFSYYITGILILLGVLLGRFICGFLCPFGWLQELLHKIPGKKLSTKKLRPLTYLKYVILLLAVVLLPALIVNDVGMGDPFFCKYICPQGVLEGAIPLAAANESIRAALGALLEPVDYLLPFFVGVCVFTFYPMIRVAVMSFQEKYTLGKNANASFIRWGLGNYKFVLFGLEGTTNIFMRSLKNTALYVLLTVPITAALSILMAYLLNQKIRFNGVFQTAYFIPMVTTATAVGLVWRWMFNENFGLINAIITTFGGEKINWLQSGNHAVSMAVLVIYGVWSSLPFTIILLLSGLQNIDENLYTVARVDGSGAARIFFRITVPLLSPTIGLVLIINSISAFKVYTDVVVLWNGTPEGYGMETVAWYIYNNINTADGTHSLGYAAAAAMVLFLIIFVFTMVQKVIQRKWVYQ